METSLTMSIQITPIELDFIISNFTQIRSKKLINGINEYYFNVHEYAKASKIAGVDRKSIRINVLKIEDIISRLQNLKHCEDSLEGMSKHHFEILLSFAPVHQENRIHDSAIIWHKNLKLTNSNEGHLLLTKKRAFDNLKTRLNNKLILIKTWHSTKGSDNK